MFLELPFEYIKQFCAEQLGLYGYQNYIELFIFTLVIYKILRWLQQDHTKHLVLYLYSYATLMITSYLLSCMILFSTMLLLMPIAALLCIVLHQKQLQKNFVLGSNKTITPQTMPAKNWLDLFIRSCLLAAYQNKQIFCIIERNDQIAMLLQRSYLLQLPIQEEIIDLILSSNALENPSTIWLHHTGIINSVNVTWKESFIHELLPIHEEAQQEALILLFTQKTDAIIFSINPKTRLAMLWHHGISMHEITIDQLVTSCKHILYKNFTDESIKKSGVTHATQNNTVHTSSKLH